MASTNDVPAGEYHIVNCVNTNLVLEVRGAATNNRAKVYVHDNDYSDSKVWAVSYHKDGTARLTYRFCGKVLETFGYTLKNGWQLSIYDNNDSHAQSWNLVPTGDTVTYNGTTYPSYWIVLASDANWYVECYGDPPAIKSDTAVDIAKYSPTLAAQADSRWLFVPVPRFTAGGTYEVYSNNNVGYCWDMPYGSRNAGTAIALHGRNQSNAQKFVFEPSGNYFKIRAVVSGLYLKRNGNVANGVKIVQQRDDGSDAFLWKIDVYANTGQLLNNHNTLYGKDCQVVQVSPKSNVNFAIDNNGGRTYDFNSISLWSDNESNAQDWALYPTDETNANIPAPYNLSATTEIGGKDTSAIQPQADVLYPTWQCADAWPNINANHYEIRSRTRTMSSLTGAWSDWTDWSGWEVANVVTEGNVSWLHDGIDGNLDISQVKAKQYGFEVRCVSIATADAVDNVIGPASSGEISVYYMPTISLTKASWSPLGGLQIDYTSDYQYGTNYLYAKRLEFAKSTNCNWSGEKDFPSAGSGSMLFSRELIPMVNNNEQVEVTYSTGSDLWPKFGSDRTSDLVVVYDTSSSVDMTQTIAAEKGRRFSVTVPHVGTEELWVYADSAQTFSRHYTGGTVKDGKTTFLVDYPFGVDVHTLVMGYQSGGAWGYSIRDIKKDDELLHNDRPAHAFTWDGGSFILEASDDTLVTDRSIDTSYDANVLNGREYESVTFGTTKKSHYKASGLLYVGVTESVAEEIESLIDARHVFYRAPSGEFANVAITAASYTRHTEYTKVDINMIEETV